MDATCIANSLLEASFEKVSPRDVLAELFPFIFTASKRMSGREISDFLEKNYEIRISQPTLARALKEPEKYTGEFARSAYEHANTVRALMELEGIDDLLSSTGFTEFLLKKVRRSIPDSSSLTSEYEMTIVQDCLSYLLEKWFKVSQDFRNLCWPEIRRLDDERKVKDVRS